MQVQEAQQVQADGEQVAAKLSDLHSVLVDGGLSGEMRSRGADAVAQASALVALLLERNAELRRRAHLAEARVAAGLAVLQGQQVPGPRLLGSSSNVSNTTAAAGALVSAHVDSRGSTQS
jgi:hypothetical protein